MNCTTAGITRFAYNAYKCVQAACNSLFACTQISYCRLLARICMHANKLCIDELTRLRRATSVSKLNTVVTVRRRRALGESDISESVRHARQPLLAKNALLHWQIFTTLYKVVHNLLALRYCK